MPLQYKQSDWLILSEFPCDSPWSGANAMTRNKTIIGLSSAVIVMESGPKEDSKGRLSGTYNSALLALKYQIPIFTLSSDFTEAPGNRELLKKGSIEINTSNCLDLIRKTLGQPIVNITTTGNFELF